MKIIDFSCRFLARLQHNELTLAATHVLLAVAAGLDSAPDIARITGMTQGTCTHLLRTLEHDKYIICVCRTGGFFRLSADGKAYVCRLFSFAHKPDPCERKDT